MCNRATPLNCSQSDDSFFIPGAGEASNLAMDIGKVCPTHLGLLLGPEKQVCLTFNSPECFDL